LSKLSDKWGFFFALGLASDSSHQMNPELLQSSSCARFRKPSRGIHGFVHTANIKIKEKAGAHYEVLPYVILFVF
jgi:hypothetical protein